MSFADQQIHDQITTGLTSLPGIPAEPGLATALTKFLKELHHWNKAYNLTAVRDPQAMVQRHVLDSLTALPFLTGERILDLGTGPGLPGIPLALCCPLQHFVLLDSNGKKIRFLQHVLAELGLENAQPVQSRVQDFRSDSLFDTVICRAYTATSEFVQHSGPLLADAGQLIAMKGKNPQSELAELPADWRVTRVEKVAVPGLEAERHIVVLQRK